MNKDHKKTRQVRAGDKFKQVFNEDWDEAEDTTLGSNTIFAQNKNVKLLFGKGHLGGMDDDLKA